MGTWTKENRVRRYPLTVLIAADQLLNALTFGNEDETVSSRLYRAKLNGKIAGKILCPIIDFIFFAIAGQTEHCKKSLGF